jgi:hypothetical protein
MAVWAARSKQRPVATAARGAAAARSGATDRTRDIIRVESESGKLSSLAQCSGTAQSRAFSNLGTALPVRRSLPSG